MQIHVGPLEAREVVFREEPSIERALGLCADHKADFADCPHLAIATTHERPPMITSDRKASRMPGARRPMALGWRQAPGQPRTRTAAVAGSDRDRSFRPISSRSHRQSRCRSDGYALPYPA